MNDLQLIKGIDDFAVFHGDNFNELFRAMKHNAIDPLIGVLKSDIEINSLINKGMNAPKLDPKELPNYIKRFIDWCSPSTHCSDEAMLLSHLCVIGAALRKSVQIEGPVGRLYPNTWQVILGRSGSAKTTGVNISINMIRPLDKEISDRHFIDYEKYEQELLRYEKSMKGKSKNNQEANLQPKYPPCKVLSFPLIASLERYVEILGYDFSSGLINTSEEMANWFVNLKKVDNLKEFLTCTYSGEVPPNFVSYKNARSVKLDKPIISILGPSTLEWLIQNLDYTDYKSGFLQRMLFVINETNKKPKSRAERRDDEIGQEFLNKVKELYYRGLQDSNVLCFKPTEEAWEYFEIVFEDLQTRKSRIQDEILLSCMDRYYNDYLFKFALILHSLQEDWTMNENISAETFKQAHLIVQYFEESLKIMLNQVETHSTLGMMKKIIDKLRNSKEYILKQDDLLNALQGYGRHREVVNLALEKLERLEIIERVKLENKSNNGIPTFNILLLEKRC